MAKEIRATAADVLDGVRASVRHVQTLALLGPEGTWTHQAALELWPDRSVRCSFMQVADMPAALQRKDVDAVLLPARTGIVGDTPYMPLLLALLQLDGVEQIANYARMLGYCLLARPEASLNTIQSIHAHPVALAEAAPWIAKHLPNARHVESASAGHAASVVAQENDVLSASLGPALAGELHGLRSIVFGIEEGPHNVTEWWVVGYPAR